MDINKLQEQSVFLLKRDFSKQNMQEMIATLGQTRALDILAKLYPQFDNEYTVERVSVIMKQFDTRSKFMAGNSRCYCESVRLGIIDAHFPPVIRREFTPEYIKSECAKYKNRTSLRLSDGSLYNHAYRAGLLDELMPSEKKVLTENDIRDNAMKCKGITEFIKRYQSSYNKAVRTDIVESLSFNDMRNAIKTIKANHQYMSVMEAMAEVEKFL